MSVHAYIVGLLEEKTMRIKIHSYYKSNTAYAEGNLEDRKGQFRVPVLVRIRAAKFVPDLTGKIIEINERAANLIVECSTNDFTIVDG